MYGSWLMTWSRNRLHAGVSSTRFKLTPLLRTEMPGAGRAHYPFLCL